MTDVIHKQSLIVPKFEEVLHPDKQAVEISLHGAQNVREHVVSAESHTSSGTAFAFTMPSQTSLLDRTALLQAEVEVVITASAANRAITTSEARRFGPEAYPLSRCMRNVNVSVNGATTSTNPNLYQPALNRFHNNEYQREMESYCPTEPDKQNNLALMLASANNPLQIESASVSDRDSRASFPYTEVIDPVAADGVVSIATRKYTLTQPIPHPVFVKSGHNTALTRVNNLRVDIQWGNLLSAFLGEGFVDATAACTVTARFTDTPAKLLLRTYEPSIEVPRNVIVPVTEPRMTSYNFSCAVNAQATVSTSNIVYPMVPKKLYVFASRQTEIDNHSSPDGWCALQSITMRTEANGGAFAGASQQQLYQMSKRNSYQGSFNEWSKRSGSILCIDVASDLGGFVPGARTPFSFDLTAVFKNTFYSAYPHTVTTGDDSSPTNFRMYVLAIFDSKLSLDGTSGFYLSGVDGNEIIESLQRGYSDSHSNRMQLHDDGMGGGFGSFMKKLLHGGAKAGMFSKDPRIQAGSALLGELTGGSIQKVSG